MRADFLCLSKLKGSADVVDESMSAEKTTSRSVKYFCMHHN